MGVWHMPYTCTPYAVHVYTLCRTRVRHMPDTLFLRENIAETRALISTFDGNGVSNCDKWAMY